MIGSVIPLVNWGLGVVMIGVFALVSLILIGLLVYFMTSGSDKEDKK